MNEQQEEEFRDAILKIVEEFVKKYDFKYKDLIGELSKILAYIHAMSVFELVMLNLTQTNQNKQDNRDIYS